MDSKLDVDFYWDNSLKSVKNMFGWANAIAKSTKNMNISDLDIKEFWDFNTPIEWFTSLNIAWEKLIFRRASEVWNIFHLWDKYTKPFKVSYLDANNKNVDKVEMWCYWIGVSRLMWVMAEYFMWEKWINWPAHIAPATYYIIVIWEDNIDTAKKIGINLEEQWETVILDDRIWRKAGFGQKAWDCEMWGIPNRIILSPKTLEKWGYELKKQGEEEIIIKI